MINDRFFKKRRTQKLLPSILAVVLLLIVSVSITLAVLTARSGGVINTFSPGKIVIDIDETFDKEEKKDVTIPNEGSVAAYIRADIVVTWENSKGNVYGQKPVEDVDYLFTPGDSGWVQGSDGFWYWEHIVAPGDETGILAESIQPIGKCADDSYTLSVKILGQAIQAQGSSLVNGLRTPAVTQAWGVTVNSDGTLKVQ